MIDTSRPAGRAEVSAPAPPAARLQRPRWRNPQLIVGVLLVLVSVVVGTRVVAMADHTVPVLAAARDLSPGEELTTESVQTRHVVLDDGQDHYVTTDPGGGQVVIREVGAGELVPRSAVAEPAEVADGPEARRFVTLAVPSGEVPAGLATGDIVDVWVTAAGTGAAERLASGLTVTAADSSGALGMSGSQATVTLAVHTAGGAEIDEIVGELIAASRDGRIYLVKLA